jgi:hypothetical protein
MKNNCQVKKIPYSLRKAPRKNLYWVVNKETGKRYSKNPIPYERASRQRRAIYANENGYILNRSKSRSRQKSLRGGSLELEESSLLEGRSLLGGRSTNGGRKRISKAPCVRSESRSRQKGRKSPPYEAYKCEGMVRTGLDGKQWVARETKNGVIRWVGTL